MLFWLSEAFVFKVAGKGFQHLYVDELVRPLLLGVAGMVSNDCPIIKVQVVVICLTLHVTIAGLTPLTFIEIYLPMESS